MDDPLSHTTAAKAAAAIQREALLGTESAATGDAGRAESSEARRPRRAFPAANSLATAMALSLSAGYLDGFTYLGHGHVFASAMTGNMVLLGIRVAARSPEALNYAFPILAYVTGVIVAHVMMRDSVARRLPMAPHVLTLILEVAVLLGIAFTPIPLADSVLISTITIATSMQNTSFRNIGARTYNSVIMTGNLQAFANALAAGTYPPTPAKLCEARDLAGVLLGFLGGAALGALVTPRLGQQAIVLPAILLGVGIGVLQLTRDKQR